MAATIMRKSKLSWLARAMVERYEQDTKGGGPFLTDAVKMAFVSEAMCSLMISQYGVEPQSGQDKFVDAYREVMVYLGLSD